MGSPGILIEKLFKNKIIHIYLSNFDGERIEYAQSSSQNKYIIQGKVIQYHADADIIELENHLGKKIYIHAENIDMFCEPEVNLSESIALLINTGKKLKKDVDIM